MLFFFFFNDTATTEIYTLSLHDALPISTAKRACSRESDDGLEVIPPERQRHAAGTAAAAHQLAPVHRDHRSEEHTSELQSQSNLVCRLLLEKKKKDTNTHAARISTIPT